jgi:hypothetical protein
MAVDAALKSLGSLIERVSELDVQVPDDGGVVEVATGLAPSMAELLQEGITQLQWVERLYETAAPEEAGVPDSLLEIGELISAEMAVREVGDLAFLARNELATCRRDLQISQREGDVLKLASACETSLRRLRRILVSIESAVYEYEGREPPMRILPDLKISLQVRNLYGRLRREILARGSATSGRMEDHLLAVASRLGELRDLNIYPFLRFDDRIQIRDLLERIADWLREGSEADQNGQRLWQDLLGFAELLKQVNHRQELREHDRQVILDACAELFEGEEERDQVTQELFSRLELLLGLDDRLDRQILARALWPADRWRPPLTRLRRQLALESQGRSPDSR